MCNLLEKLLQPCGSIEMDYRKSIKEKKVRIKKMTLAQNDQFHALRMRQG